MINNSGAISSLKKNEYEEIAEVINSDEEDSEKPEQFLSSKKTRNSNFFDENRLTDLDIKNIRKRKRTSLEQEQIIKETSKSFAIPNRIFGNLKNDSSRQMTEMLIDDNVSLYEEAEKKSEGADLDIFSDDESFIKSQEFKNEEDYGDSIIFKDKYSFTQTYKDLISKIKDKEVPLFSKVLKFKLKINLGDYILTEGLIFNYVNYELEGSRNDQPFKLYRRYSEFEKYRKLLRLNWPGVFIPLLPPKKTYGNLDDTFITFRKKYLQYFCKKICSSPHLASSFETKVFLEPKTENFLDIPIDIYQRSIEDIYKIYSKYFGFLEKTTLTEQNKREVQNFFLILTKAKKNFDDNLVLATEAKNTQMKAEKNLVNFYENNYNVEDAFYDMFAESQEIKKDLCENTIKINTTESIFQIKHENFFTTCFDWATTVSDSIAAMIECISTLYELNEQFVAKFKEIKKKNKLLKSYINQSFLMKFFFPTNLEQVQQLMNDIQQLKIDVTILKNLVNLIYKIIYFIEIPTFKDDQYNYYITFLNKINDEDSYVQKKNAIIYNLFKSKCEKMRQLFEKAY